MELLDVMQSTGTCRYYKPDPVPDEILRRVLDCARWAPSGGNRQPVSLVAIRDGATRRALQELYLPFWNEYVAGIEAGTVRLGSRDRRVLESADHFARHLADIPVFVVVCARLADVHPTDTELDRLSIVGGASIYPAVQNLLLGARDAGLGTALTTLLCAVEPEVKRLLAIPDDVSTAAMVTLGWPARPFPRQLNRRPLDEMAWGEKFGQPLGG
ncbi:MAG: nitroreductase family protein [Gammaproteobacteria bacterium]|nr:nitroreductase family protein [Gammaproteobacteria bacterium]